MCTVKDKIFIIGGESEQSKMEDPAYIYYLEIRKLLSYGLPGLLKCRTSFILSRC